jgi:hypothetical protein
VKPTLQFDPAERDYGPATDSVRSILAGWAAVDWFVAGPKNPLRAAHRFAEHHARARLHLPSSYPASFDARLKRGGWDDFDALCASVRRPGSWSWKYGPLKDVSSHHSQAAGWSPLEHVSASPAVPTPPRPGDLFLRYGENVVWTGLGMTLDFRASLPPARAELCAWYTSYADMDALFAIEWQLAERSNDTSANPFLPLLDCYAAGILPFGLGPEEFVLLALFP